MTEYINNFLSSLRVRGLIPTLKIISDKLSFESKCLLTSFKLNTKKALKKGELIVDHGKYKFIFYGGGDRGEILYHAFWDKMFSEEIQKVNNFIKPGDTVIDVGGNLGFFVLILNELVGNTGNIYTFEPSKRLKAKLESTVLKNNLQNVTIVNFALGESEATTTLHFNPKQTGLTSIVTDFETGSLSEEIQITTLDKYSENISGRVSFIKIDTEGFEPQVLNGARKLISRDTPTIYIELGGYYQNSSAQALKILKELNYDCEAYSIDLKNVPAGINFIATPKP